MESDTFGSNWQDTRPITAATPWLAPTEIERQALASGALRSSAALEAHEVKKRGFSTARVAEIMKATMRPAASAIDNFMPIER